MSTATSPLSGTYNADPVHSSFGFAVKYQGVSLYRGSLDEAQATFADGKLQGSAKVESISIKSPEQFRAHVLSPEFFDVENHPEVTFTSEDVDLADDGTAKVRGELTIKGVTKPFEATGTWTAPDADAFGNTRGHLTLEGTAKVDSISIRTPEQFRAHVLSPEFFDAATHPEVTFVSSDLDLAGDGTATVRGELTIKGITKPVEAKGTWTEPAPDAFGNSRGHLQLEAIIDRAEWDMNWNMDLPTGGKVLANDVTLTVDLSLTAQA
jgi:polyisoprenoid-binding protein YceI